MDETNKSTNSSKTDWPETTVFLEDYKNFAVQARPLLIKLIAEKHRNTEDEDQKKLLHTLGLEQFVFLIEILDAFFVSVTHRGPLDLYKILQEDHNTLIQKIKFLKKNQYFNIYKSALLEASEEELHTIANSLENVTSYMQSNAVVNKYLTGFCCKLKHNFLVYRKNDEVHPLLPLQFEEALLKEEFYVKHIKSIGKARRAWAEDMDWMVKSAEAIKKFIIALIDILIIRLQYLEAG